jgi:ABC-type transport system involved in multi-copper enzyme maturation permease subunit
VAPGHIQWSQALPSAAIAGFVAAIIMMIPLGAFGLGMLAAGALAAVLYQRRNPTSILTPGMGAKLGAVSGALGFGIFAILTSASMLILHSGGQMRTALLDAVQQSVARNSDPQAQEVLEFLKTPPGLAWMMVFVLIVMFVAFLVFSSVGGALGAALLRRKHRS